MSRLYGRKWQLMISKDGTNCLDISQLDIKFSVQKSMGDDGSQAEFTVYNLSRNSIKRYIAEGSRVIFEAGYRSEPYGMLFDGDVTDHQTIMEDGVTRELSLVAKDGDVFLNNTYLSKSFGAGMTVQDLLNVFVGQGDPEISLGDISPVLSDAKLPRGKVIVGQPGAILENLARTQEGRFYVNDRKICLVKADDPPNGQVISLTPDSGLVGTPTVTKDGIEARSLLRADLNLNKYVHITSDDLEENAELIGEGIYKIIKIHHHGDTFSDEWYSDIVGLPQPGLKPVGVEIYTK